MAAFEMSLVIRLGLVLCWVASAMAFDMSLNSNLAVYWGQNSYGAINPTNQAGWQQPIDFYCGDDTIDTFPVAFLTEVSSTGNLPTIDLANTCNTINNGVFSGTNLLNCSFLSSGIETCQKAGKIVTLSLGGASGGVGFSSDSEGEAFAQVIWDVFLGGTSATRPFGSAVLDGIDMDIEGGSQTGFTSFLTALRNLMNGGDKQYYITAAPQCPFPDSYIGTTLNEFGFDAVYVQFYNNYCGVNNYGNTNDFDFSTWDNWAKTVSPNKDIKVYIGAPGSPTAAGTGYVSASTLSTILSQIRQQYSSFGGVMLWDVSQAYANERYDATVKAALTAGGSSPTSSPSTTPTSPTSSPTSPSGAPTKSPTSTPTTPPTSSHSTHSRSPTSTPTTSPTTPSGTPTPSPTSTTPPSGTTTPVRTPTGTTTPSKMSTSFVPSKTSSSSSSAPTPTSTGCSGVDAWEVNIIYLECDVVSYQGNLYEAAWWNDATTPGGVDNGWTLVGTC